MTETTKRELQSIIEVSKYLLQYRDDRTKQQIGWDFLRFRISHLLSKEDELYDKAI